MHWLDRRHWVGYYLLFIMKFHITQNNLYPNLGLHPTATPPKQLRMSIWDRWPDSTFEVEFTFEEATSVDTNHNRPIFWSMKCHTLRLRGGNNDREYWVNMKALHQDCLGITECDNPDCKITIQTQKTPEGIDRQLRAASKCDAVLVQVLCPASYTLWTFTKGRHFTNAGEHVSCCMQNVVDEIDI